MRGPRWRVGATGLASVFAFLVAGGCTTGSMDHPGMAPKETAQVAGSLLVRDAGDIVGPGVGDERTDPRLEPVRGDAAPDVEPAPGHLPAGPARVGAFLGFGDDDVAIAGSGPREASDGPLVVIDVLRTPDADAAWCQPTVQAAPTRSLRAVGTLHVELLLHSRDGAWTRSPTERIAVGVTLEPGGRADLAPSRAVPIDPDGLVEVRCVGAFVPA